MPSLLVFGLGPLLAFFAYRKVRRVVRNRRLNSLDGEAISARELSDDEIQWRERLKKSLDLSDGLSVKDRNFYSYAEQASWQRYRRSLLRKPRS